MSSPTKEELPKLDGGIQKEIQHHKELKHCEPEVKTTLPSAEDVSKEKRETAVLKGVEGFTKDGLKHTETVEKHAMPTKEDIDQEKVKVEAASFDKDKLRHVETVEKHGVAVVDAKGAE